MVRAVLNTAKIAALGAVTLQVARSTSELATIVIEKAKEKVKKL